MPRTLQFKRYGSATLANTIGANGELIINQTNKTLTVHDGITPGGFTLLNEAIEIDIDQYARNQANTASNNITIIQGVNTTQNTNITNATNLAQSAYNYANTIVSDTQIDPYARTTANSASNNITIIQGVNSTQNTNINNASNLAQAAYDNSNTKYSSSGGTISGNVTISGILNVESTINVNNVLTVSTSPPAASPSITVIATQNHDLRLRAVSNTWTFRADSTTIFPTNITIDYSGNDVQFPRLIADSGKAFSIQGQGANGSAAMAWSIDHNADTQYAAVGTTRGGGDNLAKVILTAGNTTPTLKVWKFDQTGAFTFPDLSVQNTAFTDAQVTNISNANTKAQAAFDKANTGVQTYANSNVISLLSSFGSNNITTTGNVTASRFIGDGSALSNVIANIAGNIVGTQPNVTLVAGSYDWTFDNTGTLTLPGNTFDVKYNNGTQVDIITRFEGSWNVATGNSTVSFTVPEINNTYQLWVLCNIPNGIISYQATVSVTNTNVPVLGTQRAWNYTDGGSPIMLTTMPTQIVGAEGTISTAVPATTTANTFDFGINNTSGSSQTVRYGWVKIS